jgi:pimeloyl-ACP methyl ester carboxylesterase
VSAATAAASGLARAPSRERVTSDDGTILGLTRAGSGPVLVIVDGAFCFRGHGPSEALASELAAHFTVITYDRRGRGESTDTPPSVAAAAVAREVEDLRAVVRAAGGPAFALGVSSGGALAMQAVAAGVPLRALALYEPPFLKEGGRWRSNAEHLRRLRERLSAGDRGGAVRYFMRDIYGAPGWFVALMPYVMRRAWKANESVAPTLVYDLTLLDDSSIVGERAPSVAAPALVLGGTKSPASLREAVASVAAALPNARTQLLEGQTHNLQARVVAPVAAAFFRSV